MGQGQSNQKRGVSLVSPTVAINAFQKGRNSQIMSYELSENDHMNMSLNIGNRIMNFEDLIVPG